jgi:hypothetical protein
MCPGIPQQSHDGNGTLVSIFDATVRERQRGIVSQKECVSVFLEGTESEDCGEDRCSVVPELLQSCDIFAIDFNDRIVKSRAKKKTPCFPSIVWCRSLITFFEKTTLLSELATSAVGNGD